MPADKFKHLIQERLNLRKRVASGVHLDAGLQIEKNSLYFYPELLVGAFETVHVTEVNNPESIFCKIQIFTKAVKTFSEQIHSHYEVCSDIQEAQPQICGDPCAVRGKDSRWHRSLLKENMKSSGTVEVFHVDEGKVEHILIDDIKPLHGEFLRMPVYTYHCSLDGVQNNETGWTTEQIEYLKSLLLNQTVVAKLNSHNTPQDVYGVTLYTCNSECVNKNFMEKLELLLPCKTEQDSRVPTALSTVNSRGDYGNVNLSKDKDVDLLVKKTNDLQINGRENDTSDVLYIEESYKQVDLVVPINDHHQAGVHCVMPNANGFDDLFTPGGSINVKVSCVESLQKFWCQTIELNDSFHRLMQDLQNHYASTHPEPVIESICVARNPDNNMWYRARIIASTYSPVVDVQFIDYGQTERIPLRDVRPIDPAFLCQQAKAFQCCLFDPKSPSSPTPTAGTDVALEEFQKFLDDSALSKTGLKCIFKAVTTDEEGLPLYLVDIESASESACRLIAEKVLQAKVQELANGFIKSTHNVAVGTKETVLVTSSESVNHFYCQLERNSSLLDKMMGNLKQLIGQRRRTEPPLRLNSICLAKYTDNQWYRGQVAEVSPNLKVHFVDYGDTLTLNESDVCSFPAEACIARSAPVQAVPVGLYNVPAEVPQEVNQWFAEEAIGCNFTISVVAKEAGGKLVAELFNGSLNVNQVVRERINTTQKKVSHGPTQQAYQKILISSEHTNVLNDNCFVEEIKTKMMSPKMLEREAAENGMCSRDQQQEYPQPKTNATQAECETTLGMSTLSIINEADRNMNSCRYKRPNMSPNKTADVYASSIVGPNYFWCQYANSEDLEVVSRLVQEAGQMQQDTLFNKSLGPGSPCLALFSDKRWYRAQVIKRTESSLRVLFIDYGNESDVDIQNVRPLTQSLLDAAPQAFLCSLNGFDESIGSWDDEVYDVFYTLLVDKKRRVTVVHVEDHPEITVPQYAVQILGDDVLVNESMQKYWKNAAAEHVDKENSQKEDSILDSQTELNSTHLSVFKENVNTFMYKTPNIPQNQNEVVYASSIAEPHYFWCQSANTEELHKISSLVQEAGQIQQDDVFLQTLIPGSPCLALFSDNQWYRAQVIQKTKNSLHVLFVDYGNESDVDIKHVRPVPQPLLDAAPQAFLCFLEGFDVSRGFWDSEVTDEFYNLLVDKPLKLKVYYMKDHSDIHVPQFAVEIECDGVLVNTVMKKNWKTLEENVSRKSSPTEALLQKSQTEPATTHSNLSKGNMNTPMYKEPKVSKSKAEMAFASCIVEPHFFWCQYANTEELNKVTQLAQEAGQMQHDIEFVKTLCPGSPCLALFSSDNQWYRAQVTSKDAGALHVMFIDYGNESDIDFKNVRPLTQSLLDAAPQALLCSLNGFNESEGSWDDQVYDDFYTLLVDKPLKVTVQSMQNHKELAIPQFKVDVECDGVVVNELMEKYWKGLKRDHTLAEDFGAGQDEKDF